MSTEKVFVVLFHTHVRRPRTTDKWDVAESVEFVSTLRDRHLTQSVAVGDYVNSKMVSGKRTFDTYPKFIAYIRDKYPLQTTELDSKYGHLVKSVPVPDPMVQDQFGNLRPKTVFD